MFRETNSYFHNTSRQKSARIDYAFAYVFLPGYYAALTPS
jgi:hypothetical protein